MRLVLAFMACFGLVSALLWLASDRAEALAPSAETGADIAARWCADCHVVSPSGAGVDHGPSFPSLSANRKPEQIMGSLSAHAQPLKGFTLSAREVQDVTAYIASLKTESAQ